jgi:hypothetical protein
MWSFLKTLLWKTIAVEKTPSDTTEEVKAKIETTAGQHGGGRTLGFCKHLLHLLMGGCGAELVAGPNVTQQVVVNLIPITTNDPRGVRPGTNIGGTCPTHGTVYHHFGMGEYRPNEYETPLECRACRHPFRDELILLSDCRYEIAYRVAGGKKKARDEGETAGDRGVQFGGIGVEGVAYTMFRVNASPCTPWWCVW